MVQKEKFCTRCGEGACVCISEGAHAAVGGKI
jgi:hypothetical protein